MASRPTRASLLFGPAILLVSFFPVIGQEAQPEDWAVFPLPLPAGLEPAWVQKADSTVSTVQTLRDLAVFQQKIAGFEEKSQALLLLAEAGKAMLAGKTAIAREYTLRAKNLRPSSTWNQQDLIQLRSYLQRLASAGAGRTVEKKVSPLPSSSQAPPIDKKPAVKDSALDLLNQVTPGELQAPPPESSDEDEAEPTSEARNRTPAGSTRRWFVVAGIVAILLLGVALRKLFLGPIVKTGTTSN